MLTLNFYFYLVFWISHLWWFRIQKVQEKISPVPPLSQFPVPEPSSGSNFLWIFIESVHEYTNKFLLYKYFFSLQIHTVLNFVFFTNLGSHCIARYRKLYQSSAPTVPLYKSGVGKVRPMAKSGHYLLFVHKALLEHSHTHLFIYCVRLLLSYSYRVDWFHQRLFDLQSLEYLLSSPLQKELADSQYTCSIICLTTTQWWTSMITNNTAVHNLPLCNCPCLLFT